MRWDSQQWTFASLASGAVALVALLLAMATAHWLHLKESCVQKFLLPNNETLLLNITTLSNAGLWQICTSTDGSSPWCLSVGFSQGLQKERVEDQWRTGAVIEATRIQFPLTCTAVMLTLCGFVYSILGNFRKDRKTIIAAVMYIFSGLCLSVSVIIFISRINDELALQQSKDCFEFEYRYGWSFYLVGVSFVMEETSAVISIKLFLSRNLNKLDDMVRIIPGLEDKLFVENTRLNRLDSASQTLIW